MLALGNATGFLDAARNDSSGALRAICLRDVSPDPWCIDGLSVMSSEAEASLITPRRKARDGKPGLVDYVGCVAASTSLRDDEQRNSSRRGHLRTAGVSKSSSVRVVRESF
jgi:hypothetical protein